MTQSEGLIDTHFGQLEGADRAFLNSLLVALRTRDADTYEHSARAVVFGSAIGRACGLDAISLRALELGALLHDIGKIGVPDAILRKPGKLDSREWERMRRHPRDGRGILLGLSFLEDAARVVLQHHENWDGTGYPLGLRGEEIDLNARILAVADAFDAMVSDRVYRPARSYEAAVEELDRCAGMQFDPLVVEAFHRVPRGLCEGASPGGRALTPRAGFAAAPGR
jgi:HD-GYP domain-containing protein (c-di-GMP phosphodiesterase class II)